MTQRRFIAMKLCSSWPAFFGAWALIHFQGLAARPDGGQLLKQGKFTEAQHAFESMAEKSPDDARWRYNAGVAAFKSGEPALAQKHFEAATASPDLSLQSKAWYNLGNAWFQMANAPGTENPEKALQQAAEAFGAAKQLNPQDHAAADNLTAVKQILEELEKQKQEQESEENDSDQDSQNKDSKDKNKDKKQKSKKNQKDSKKQNENSESDKDDADDSQKKEDSKKNGNDQKDPNSEENKQNKGQNQKQNKDQKGAGDQSKSDPNKSGDPSQNSSDPQNQAQQPTNGPAPGPKTNSVEQAKKDQKRGEGDKDARKEPDIKPAEGNEAGGSGQLAGDEALGEGQKMSIIESVRLLDAQKGTEKPIWTIMRRWGQEKPNDESRVWRKQW